MPNTTDSNATTFSAESYFETQPAPSTLQADIHGVESFIDKQIKEGRKVVLVTVNCSRCVRLVHRSYRLSRAGAQPFHWSSMCERKPRVKT